MAVSSHPPLLPSLSQLSLGITRTSRDFMSETLLASEGDSENSGSSGLGDIHHVSPRIIPGPCHSNNKGCIDWGPQGLIAYGANLCVAVLDPKTCQPVQCMLKHKAVVKKVLWAPLEFGKLRLVSSDMSGNLILWNVEDGASEVIVQDDKKPVLGLAWTSQPSTYRSASSLLPPLAALHSPYSLIIWDMNQGLRLWRKVFTDTLLSFDIDPFDPTKLAFQCPDCILFIDDFSVSRIPSSNGRKFYISSPKMSDPDEYLRSKDRLKRLMRGLTVGEMKPRAEDAMTLSECLQLSYHRALRHHILLLYARDILIIDLHINMSVGVIPIERAASPLTQVISCQSRDVLFCLHESGNLTVKLRRQYVSHASKQEVPGTPYPPETEREKEEGGDLCVWYEHRAQTELTKQGKGLRIMGLVACPTNENKLCVLLNSGKLVTLNLELNEPSDSIKPRHLHSLSDIVPPSNHDRISDPTLRLVATGVLQNSSTQITTISMCPPLSAKNMLHYNWYLAAGTALGHILLFNVTTGLLEKQINAHTAMPVKGIEWISSHSFLSWAYTSNSSSSTMTRNDLVLTDTYVGHSVSIRKSEVDEPYIFILKASPLKQYFILILKDGPFELWDLRHFQLLRVMPKKIPVVTALEWSSPGKAKKLKQKLDTVHRESSEEFNKNDDFSSFEDPRSENQRKYSEELLYASTQESMDKPQTPVAAGAEQFALPVKERVVFTDNDSHLYYFIVEGNTLKDGIRIPPEENARRVNYLALKHNHIVQAHMDGTLHVWDLKAKKSWVKDLGRRWIRMIKFAPGKDNLRLLVLCSDGVDVLDVTEDKPCSDCQLKYLRDVIVHIDWASSENPLLLAQDGSILILDKTLEICSSPLHRYANFTAASPLFWRLSKPRSDSLLLFLCSERLQQIVPLDYLVPRAEDLHDKIEEVIQEEELEEMELVDRYILVCAILGDVKLHNLMCLLKYYTSVHVREHNSGYDGSSEVNMSIKRLNLHPSIIPLETSYDVFQDPYHYQKLELDRTLLHESKRGDYKHIENIIQRLILLGETDRAVQLLLETQITNENYYTDAMKACLVATIQSTGAAQSTIKLVATNLIANERIWEGVQLLCLINKGLDACKYLISYGLWYDAVWLSKSILNPPDMNDVIKKWAAHLNNAGDWYSALLAYVSIGHYETGLEILLDKQEYVIAWLILNLCDEVDIQISMAVKAKLQAALSHVYKDCDIGIVDVLFSRMTREEEESC